MSHSYPLGPLIKAALVAVGLSSFVALPAQAGPYSDGNTGTPYNSTAAEEYATQVVSYNPGPDEIGVANSPVPTFDDTSQALGEPNAEQNSSAVVSLGDGGSIVLSFASPIVNGPGADFSVFENGFASGPSGQGYLELGTVSVSSNGTNFFTFPDVSLTQTTTQVGAFGTLDPTNLYDLAGKTFAGVGTDFDLSELADVSSLLDVNDIQYVKVTDVVGSINPAYGTYDSQGNLINDPWPTPFASSGFDLDGIIVLHDQAHVTPEPSTWLLLVAGLLAALAFRRLRSLVLIAAAVVALPAAGFADTVDFSNLTPTTPYTGSGGGDYTNDQAFTEGNLSFNNYSDQYGDWAGFAYSNTHDETSPAVPASSDYENEYSAAVASFSTANPVPTYALGYIDSYDEIDPTITFANGAQPLSVEVTNTVYTYNAIKYGDSFATAFTAGSYFTLDIEGFDTSGVAPVSTGTVAFNLALYPADGSTPTVVDNWTSVDLSSLGAGTNELVFTEQSSDTGDSGINTPTFFALKSVTTTATPEPAVSLLFLSGVVGLAFFARRAQA